MSIVVYTPKKSFQFLVLESFVQVSKFFLITSVLIILAIGALLFYQKPAEWLIQDGISSVNATRNTVAYSVMSTEEAMRIRKVEYDLAAATKVISANLAELQKLQQANKQLVLAAVEADRKYSNTIDAKLVNAKEATVHSASNLGSNVANMYRSTVDYYSNLFGDK
jgi:hypothetical protein